MSFSLADALTLISVLVPILVPLGMALYQHLLDGLPTNRQAVVSQVVENAVTAVEQMVGSGAGPLKKDRATELVNEMLASRHITVSPGEVSALIECSVAALNEAQDAKPKPLGFTTNLVGSDALAPAGDPGPSVPTPSETPQPTSAPAPAGILSPGIVGLVAAARVVR